MRTTTVLSALAAATVAAAQGQSSNSSSSSNSTSICDHYAGVLFKVSNATTQYNLLTALVNTAVIGNWTDKALVPVTGILNNGTYNGQDVSLLKYFDGMLASSNRGGDHGVAVNFLDGGGADPLKMSKPANDTTSNQYFLLTHLYSFFGSLLKCSAYSKEGFPAYAGHASMYAVHKFMDLDQNEVGYFIQEVGLAAKSFGVSNDDAMAVGDSLNKLFGYKCAPNATVIEAQGSQAQSICVADSCPLAPNGNCSVGVYQQAPVMPGKANDTNMYTSKPTQGPTGTMGSSGGSASSTSSSAGSSGTDATGRSGSSSGAASAQGVGALVMGVAGFFALAAGL